MHLEINKKSKTSLYLQISNGIKEKIYNNEIFEGYQLPSERFLAKQLDVNRNTVVKAYEDLIDKGLVVSSRGKPRGYFIFRERYALDESKHFFTLEKNMKYQMDAYSNLFGDIYEDSIGGDNISFGGMVVNEELFPTKQVNEILLGVVKNKEKSFFEYCNPKGNDDLRNALANMLRKRAMKVNKSNIQVVSELQGIGYISKLYLRDGGVIIAEEPVVPEIVNLFINTGIRVVTIPMENDGMNMRVLEDSIAKHKPKFIYTMPNFHIPSGILTSFEKRKKLLELAYRYNIPIIEEDTQRELYYGNKNLPTLYAMDEREQVIYIDSFAFTFFPGALIGYIIAPTGVVENMCKIVRMEQILVNGASQYLTYKFLDTGNYEIHVERLRKHYKAKRDLMCSELENLRSLGIDFQIPEGGLLVWIKLPKWINEQKFYQDVKALGVIIIPGFLFFPSGNKGDSFCRLSFSNVTNREIVKGIRILGEVIRNRI